MNQNHFSKKMASKTEAELETIIADKKNFVDDARLAAIWELENRKGKTDSLLKAEEELENLKSRRESQISDNDNLLDFGDDTILDSTSVHAPLLYSKQVIWIFSALFSTIIGSVLLAMNAYTVKNKNGIFIALLCGIGFVCAMIVLLAFVPEFSNMSFILNALGGAIMSEVAWNTIIGKETKYRKRNYILPLVISIAFTIVIGLTMFYDR